VNIADLDYLEKFETSLARILWIVSRLGEGRSPERFWLVASSFGLVLGM
jgi:hypothetical protein